MKALKNPVVAIILCVLIVFVSSAVSISVKLSNKCEDVTESFYYGVRQNGILSKSVYYSLNDFCDLASEIVLVADNYGIDTRKLVSGIDELRRQISFENPEIDDIYDAYQEFYNALWNVELALSETDLSQRHIEFMNSAVAQLSQVKLAIDNSGYNDIVRSFYKKFDRFPANLFADIFDIEFPEYFA